MYACDSAIHQIVSANEEKPLYGDVIIESGVYLGFRTMLLKGTIIPTGSVVGSGAVCTSDYSRSGEENLFICGNPAVVKEKNVTAKF